MDLGKGKKRKVEKTSGYREGRGRAVKQKGGGLEQVN